MNPDFQIGTIVIFKLTGQKAMILGRFHKGESIFAPTYDGYLVRLDNLTEIAVRDTELGEENNGTNKS